jgi:hypothetical protein
MITVRRMSAPCPQLTARDPKVSRSLPSVRWLLDKGRVILAKLAPTIPKRGLLRTYKLRAGAGRGENDVT